MVRIGGHFHSDNPLDDAVACGVLVAQFFLGDPQALLGVVRAAGAPVVCETPEAGLADDIAWLRDRTA